MRESASNYTFIPISVDKFVGEICIGIFTLYVWLQANPLQAGQKQSLQNFDVFIFIG